MSSDSRITTNSLGLSVENTSDSYCVAHSDGLSNICKYRLSQGAFYTPLPHMTVEQAAERNDLSRVIKQFGSWVVTEYGIESLKFIYAIPKHELNHDDWLRHMAIKYWVSLPDLLDALRFAMPPKKPVDANKRKKKISPSKRFAILRRDCFSCCLCGRSAAVGVVLHVDHKNPRANGGGNDDANLWTLCSDCNHGKSDTVDERLMAS